MLYEVYASQKLSRRTLMAHRYSRWSKRQRDYRSV